MNQPPVNRRPPFYKRRYLVDHRFQLSLIGYFLGIFLCSMGLLFYGIRSTLTLMDELAVRLDPRHSALLQVLQQERQTFLNEYFVLYALAIVVSTIAGGLFISHRMAGPVFRLKRILEDLADGKNVEKIEFRKRDFLQDLLPSLRKVAQRISDKRS